MPVDIVAFCKEELQLADGGLDLQPEQAEMMQSFVEGHYTQAIWRCGRRGGKSLMADALCIWDAVGRGHLSDRMRTGERRICAIVAPSLYLAKEHVRNISWWLHSNPRLEPMIVEENQESILLSNSTLIAAMAASGATLRGRGVSSVILDELGHFVNDEGSTVGGQSVVDATLWSLGQFGAEGWLIAISTPRWRAGAFYKLDHQAQSGQFPHMQWRHKSTYELNPWSPEHPHGITKEWLEQQRLQDPDKYAQESLAEFIDGASSYLRQEDVLKAIRSKPVILPPRQGIKYTGAIDPAYNSDGFSLCIGHRDGDGIVIDGAWVWRPKGTTPIGHYSTIAEVADLALDYNLTTLRTDQHSTQPIAEGLARHGITARALPWSNSRRTPTTEPRPILNTTGKIPARTPEPITNKPDAFSTVKLALSSGRLELPDNPDLIQELMGLEAKPTPSGLTKIEAGGGGHDDMAHALAAVCADLSPRQHHRSKEETLRMSRDLDEIRAIRPEPNRRGLDGLGMVGGGSFGGGWPF